MTVVTLTHAHLVRLIVIDGGGRGSSGVAVDPAGAHMHPAAEIQDLPRRCRLRQSADGGYPALLDGDIDELAISWRPALMMMSYMLDGLWSAARRAADGCKCNREEGAEQHGPRMAPPVMGLPHT